MRQDWTDVPGYEKYIQVTSDGQVRRKAMSIMVTRKGQHPYTQRFPEKELSPYTTKDGYCQVSPKIDGKRIKIFVHRLVGWAFVPGYKEGYCINHINGNKTDNRAENLEWTTLIENSKHEWRIGLVDFRGEKSPSAKLTSKQVRVIRNMLRKGVTCNAIATLTGLSTSTIYLIKTGQRWQSIT